MPKQLSVKEIAITTVDDIKQQKIDKSLLLEWTKQATAQAKRRKTNLQKALVEKGYEVKPTSIHERPDKGRKGQKSIDFNIDYTKVNKAGGYAYLLSVYARAREFLMMKTSTIKGWEKSMENFKNAIERQVGKVKWGDFLTDEEITNKIFSLYEQVKNTSNSWGSLGSAKVIKQIVQYTQKHKDLSYEKLLENLKRQGRYHYSKNQEKREKSLRRSGVKDIFSLDGDL